MLPTVVQPVHLGSACCVLVFLIGVFGLGSPVLWAATLEEQLHAEAPKLLDALRDRGCSTVGVLKFRVQRIGQGTLSDDEGPLNMLIANRLEAALTLANPIGVTKQILIVRNASSVAAQDAHSNHLTPEGRSRLHKKVYQASWGGKQTEVDAFLTGLIQVGPDLRSIRVWIMAAIRGEPELIALTNFVAKTNGAILSELGESFHLRATEGVGVSGDELAKLALGVRRDPPGKFPLQDRPAVSLKIFYDDKPIEIEFTDSEARIPEPWQGQKVHFEIARLDEENGKLGVVLKVNGENTLYRQRRRDYDCAKWHLGAGQKTVIRAFQEANSTDRGTEFEVLSREESKALEMYYGEDLGMISMVVFAEESAQNEPKQEALAPELVAIAKADFPKQTPETLVALKDELRGLEQPTNRGIIGAGEQIEQQIRLVKGQWAPEPIMSVVIRYYAP